MKLYRDRYPASREMALDLSLSLEFRQVELPGVAVGPRPWDLQLGLTEFLLLEGLTPAEAEVMMRCAATLLPPAAGQVFHWGLELRNLAREEMFRWRRRIGLVPVEPVLLDRLTVRQNLVLAQRYDEGGAAGGDGAQELDALVEELHLRADLDRYPRALPPEVHFLAVWAREFLKHPRLMLWALDHRELSPPTAILLPVLARIHREQHVAICIAGPDLAFAYPCGHRLIRVGANGMTTHALPGLAARPLTAALPIL